jgi:hypothetical protein
MMKIHAAVALVAALALGCGGGPEPQPKPDPKPEPKVEPKGDPRPALMPDKLADPEPSHILVAHVLVSFAGTKTKATRTQAAAEKLAYEVLTKARKGDDFNKLIRDFSDDEGEGVYGLSNHRVNPDANEYSRKDMVAAFGDVGFKLEAGSIGMSVYDAKKSPYGWHIIKRLK